VFERERTVGHPVEIGEGTGDGPYPGDATGGEPTCSQCLLQHHPGFVRHRRMGVERRTAEGCVQHARAVQRPGSGSSHPFGHVGRRLLVGQPKQLTRLRSGDTDAQVEAIQQRAGHPTVVASPSGIGTAARTGCARLAAGARVHGGHQQQTGRVRDAAVPPTHPDLTVLERLAEAVEGDGRELAQLVEEQDTPVGQGDLTRPHDRGPATHQRHGRCAVMRRPERRFEHQRNVVAEPTGRRMHPRDLERFRVRQRRKEARQPTSQHGLSRTGRPDHQQVVATRRSQLERELRHALPADVLEIECRLHPLGAGRRPHHGPRHLTPNVGDQLLERGHRMHPLEFEERHLMGVGRRDDQPIRADLVGHGERTTNRADRAVEAQFAEETDVGDVLDLQGLGGDENPHGDGEVEGRPRLRHLGGRQIDRDTAAGPVVATREQGRPHAVSGLPAGRVRQADDSEPGQSARSVDLDLDRMAVNADERGGMDGCEHGGTRSCEVTGSPWPRQPNGDPHPRDGV